VKSWQVRDEQRRLKMSHSRRMGFSSHRIPNVRQPQCLLVHQACHICFAQKAIVAISTALCLAHVWYALRTSTWTIIFPPCVRNTQKTCRFRNDSSTECIEIMNWWKNQQQIFILSMSTVKPAQVPSSILSRLFFSFERIWATHQL